MTDAKGSAVRLIGTVTEHKEGALVALAMLVVTLLYEAASAQFAPGFTFNWFEFIGTWSGLTCVWLARTRNLLSWPWGIVSCISLGFFFSQIGLPGQQWLNWGYFLVIQLWAWPHWVFGGADKTELPVSRLSWTGRLSALSAVALGTLAVFLLIDRFSPQSFHPILDSLVVAASVVAQFLLGRKKIESWVLWLGPVNLLSITLFFAAGAYTLTALYVAFFIHACFALVAWQRAEEIKE